MVSKELFYVELISSMPVNQPHIESAQGQL